MLHFSATQKPPKEKGLYMFLNSPLMFLCHPGFSLFNRSLCVSGVVYTELQRPCRTMILVNPHSGRGQALQLFTGHVQGMLTEASVPYTLVITGQSEMSFLLAFIWHASSEGQLHVKQGIKTSDHFTMDIRRKTGLFCCTWAAQTFNLYRNYALCVFFFFVIFTSHMFTAHVCTHSTGTRMRLSTCTLLLIKFSFQTCKLLHIWDEMLVAFCDLK